MTTRPWVQMDSAQRLLSVGMDPSPHYRAVVWVIEQHHPVRDVDSEVRSCAVCGGTSYPCVFVEGMAAAAGVAG